MITLKCFSDRLRVNGVLHILDTVILIRCMYFYRFSLLHATLAAAKMIGIVVILSLKVTLRANGFHKNLLRVIFAIREKEAKAMVNPSEKLRRTSAKHKMCK